MLLQTTQKYLSDVEIQVLQGAWEGKTYEAITERPVEKEKGAVEVLRIARFVAVASL